jgi:CRP-like cAMP-binding protein
MSVTPGLRSRGLNDIDGDVTDTGAGSEGQSRLISRYGRRFSAGTVLFRDGDPATEAFLLQDGRVRLLKQAGRMERSLRVVRPGDLFGESALIRGASRSSTAVALDDVVTLAFDHATFEQVLATSPEVAGRVLSQLIRRMRDAEDQIEILMLRDAQSKVVVALLKFAQQELAVQTEDGRASGGQISLTLSPLELSAQVGLDVDTVKRIVAQLRETGHVRIQDERVEVPNIDSLRDLYTLLGIKDQLRGQGQGPGGPRTRAR